jgi:hypothetical protein
MKCVAEVTCQSRLDDGTIRTFDKGDVWDFKVKPTHFRVLESTVESAAPPVDFETAGESELLEGEYELSELKDYVFSRYGKRVGARGLGKSVDFLLDCRYRALSV